MATHALSTVSLRSKIEEEHLTCTICYELFKHPKALPCLHTFCYECLRDYICGRGFEAQGKFPCPVCRVEIIIPEMGISGFQDNYTMLSLIDTINRSRTGPAVPPRPKITPDLTQNDNTENNNTPNIGPEGVQTPSVQPQYPNAPHYLGDPLYPTVPPESRETRPQEDVPCSKGLLVRLGQYGPTLTDFHKPYGLAIGKNGEFIVSDLGGSRILVFSSSGEVLARFGCDCKISGITVTRENNVLVAVNVGSEIMRIYNFDGRVLGKYGEYYKYEKPSGIAINSKEHIAVTNLESNSVYVFTEQKKFSFKFGWKGSGDNHFNFPQFLAINSKDNIVVSDSGNNCVKVFTSMGNFKRKFGHEGSDHGQFICPMGIATDSKNNIVVADSGNYRVEIFSPKGLHLKCLIKDTDEIGEEVKPLNVAVTRDDYVAVLFRGHQFAEVRLYHWSPPVF